MSDQPYQHDRLRRVLRQMLVINAELIDRPGLRPVEMERLVRAYRRTRALAHRLGICLDDA